jgi:two-component system cell cycle response regulator DivK
MATDPAQPLVLVVDDFDDSREMLAEYLTLSGFRVTEAANGQEALDRAREQIPDVVLMDLSLPVIDGWEATRQLKADPRTRSVPVLALSGHSSPAQEREALEVGCVALLTKPCPPDVLVREIRRVLAAR